MANPWGTQPKTQVSQPKLQTKSEEKTIVEATEIPKFNLEEAKLSPKVVLTIYGDKGAGKTTLALGFPGTIAVLSFDRKSTAPKVNFYNNDPRIKVYDAVKYWNRDTSKVRETSIITWEYVKFILSEIAKNPPDWIVIDGIEIFQKIAEMVMRQRNNLLPYQGIANLNLWKERNSIIEELHRLCLNIAKKGVIYTTYSQYDEIIEEGSVVTKDKIPKYIDAVMWETDIVLFIQSKFDRNSNKFFVTLRCDTSKFDNLIKTGSIFDITGKKITDIVDFSKFFGGGQN